MKRTAALLVLGLCIAPRCFASPINLTFTPPDTFPLFSQALVTISGLISYSDPAGVITPNAILDPGNAGDDVSFTTVVGSGQSENIAMLPDNAEVVRMTGTTDPTSPDLAPVAFDILWGVLAGDTADGWIPFALTKDLPTIMTDFQIVDLGINLGSPGDDSSVFSSTEPVLSLGDPGGTRIVLDNGIDNPWYVTYTPSGVSRGKWGTLESVTEPSALALLALPLLLAGVARRRAL